jgi:tetraacyldisaccharide-1-P 4'-kinase
VLHALLTLVMRPSSISLSASADGFQNTLPVYVVSVSNGEMGGKGKRPQCVHIVACPNTLATCGSAMHRLFSSFGPFSCLCSVPGLS